MVENGGHGPNKWQDDIAVSAGDSWVTIVVEPGDNVTGDVTPDINTPKHVVQHKRANESEHSLCASIRELGHGFLSLE